MNARIIVSGLFVHSVLCGTAAAMEAPTCEQIREQIQSQTGVLSKANIELLKMLSSRQECHFSAADVYRAAYGDKPLPKPEARSKRKHNDDD